MRKKNFWNKKVKSWNGKDTTLFTVFLTTLTALPFIGILIKEKLD